MKRRQSENGDIILIPLAPSQWGVARVLFVSDVYKHMILLGVFPEMIHTQEMPANLPDRYLPPLIYTGSQFIKKGNWPTVGNLPLSKHEDELSLRVELGNLWLKDKCLRPANPEELEKLPYLEVWGCGVVETYMKQAILGMPGPPIWYKPQFGGGAIRRFPQG